MEIKVGQKVRVICTADRLKEIGMKEEHFKHILGKIGTVKEIRMIPLVQQKAYFVQFKYIKLKAAEGNRQPYYALLEDMIEPVGLTILNGKDKKQVDK